PEYGPLGATSPTSFANVDLAQVATPAAPASGFSRLFASAVDSQLWYELPTGRLIPVSQQAKLQLWSVVSTDLVNGIAAATGAWTDLTTNTAFSTEDSASLVEVSVQATIQVVMGGAAGTVGLRLSLDTDSRIADIVQIDDALLPTLQQPGAKKLNADGTISVTPPGPIAPPPKSADQQSVAAWANSATPLVTPAIAQAIARLLGAL